MAGFAALEHVTLRTERHCSNALALAKYLEQHPAVRSVNYPSLKSNPYHVVARSQMTGCSSLLSFEIDGSYYDAVNVIDSLELWILATHFGTAKTVVTHPPSTTHLAMGDDEMKKSGISPAMIRVSVGLEGADDIIADVSQAMARL